MRGLLLFSWFMIPRNEIPQVKISGIEHVNWMIFQIQIEILLVGLKILVRSSDN